MPTLEIASFLKRANGRAVTLLSGAELLEPDGKRGAEDQSRSMAARSPPATRPRISGGSEPTCWFSLARSSGGTPAHFCPILLAMQVTLELPEALSDFLSASGQDLSRAALEAIALEAYRENKLSTGQLRQLLGYRTRMQVHALLKERGVYLHYDMADLEHDRQAGDALPL